MQYLHEGHRFPILYRDLKPEHIIIRGDQIVLIDYGSALYDRGGGVYEPYGTQGYVSPETLQGKKSDVRGDIYSLGVIAKFLLSHVREKVPFGAKRLITSAMEEDINLRISSISEYAYSWKSISPKNKSNEYPVTGVAVVGVSPSCGVTHIAISLVVYFNSTGQNAYYTESPAAGVCQHLVSSGRGFREKELVVNHHNFTAVYNVEEGLESPKPPYGIRVLDAGCDMQLASKEQLVVLVVGSRPWQDKGIHTSLVNECDAVLVNPSNTFAGRRMADFSGRKVYAFPLDDDAFYLSAEKRKLFEKIMQDV